MVVASESVDGKLLKIAFWQILIFLTGMPVYHQSFRGQVGLHISYKWKLHKDFPLVIKRMQPFSYIADS